MTDYAEELTRIEAEWTELEQLAVNKPTLNTEQATRRAYRAYQRAALSGRLDHFATAETAIGEALVQTLGWPDLWLLKANLDLKFHRLEAVKQDLAMAPGLRESFQGRVLLADMAFQEGNYLAAKSAYESMIEDDRTWDNLARLAFWESKFDGMPQAEKLYLEAEDEITAKEMRSFAWVELQRGLIDLRSGRYAEAAVHYQAADRGYSGYWLTADHTAELLGAQGQFEAAAAIYERLLEGNPRPELEQACGELYDEMDRPAEAKKWFARAEANFLQSAEAGGVQYYHHLVDYYSDVLQDGAQAVLWGEKDFAFRPNFATEAALAWAYYVDGKINPAAHHMDHALASGAVEAHMLSKAAEIFEAAHQPQRAAALASRAQALNPDHQNFHVHRS